MNSVLNYTFARKDFAKILKISIYLIKHLVRQLRCLFNHLPKWWVCDCINDHTSSFCRLSAKVSLFCVRWYTVTWNPLTSSTWTSPAAPSLCVSVILASRSSYVPTTACWWRPATPPTLWRLKCSRSRATTPPVTSGVWASCYTPCWPGKH